jgi:hypothetical protein
LLDRSLTVDEIGAVLGKDHDMLRVFVKLYTAAVEFYFAEPLAAVWRTIAPQGAE